MKLSCLLFIFYFSSNVLAEDCPVWFKKTGIKRAGDCLIECAIAETDMGTFHCPEQCADLCKAPIKKHFLFNLSYLYLALNPLERALVAKHPKKMMKAYQLTWSAENLCSTLFRKSATNDASDACRHFVWAALLYKQFGSEFSQQILNAHEHEPKQPAEEKMMDLKNNQLGLTTAEQLSKKNNLNRKTILKSFQKNLQEGKLIIIDNTTQKPGGKK